jgi:hypothetical protein
MLLTHLRSANQPALTGVFRPCAIKSLETPVLDGIVCIILLLCTELVERNFDVTGYILVQITAVVDVLLVEVRDSSVNGRSFPLYQVYIVP